MQHNVSRENEELLAQASRGDARALGALLARHRNRLHLMVRLRLDRRLRGRLDPSDVIQEAYLEATARFAEYRRDPAMSFALWLRFLTAQKLVFLHRHHLGVKARDVCKEISLYQGALPGATAAALAAQLLGHLSTPSEAAIRTERRSRLHEALQRMDALDREVLVLRHFEQLTNDETAQLLGIRPSAASHRYGRALLRLKVILLTQRGGPDAL
jgi:RNA polymerase sigma-70 factor (ECF subfamily)